MLDDGTYILICYKALVTGTNSYSLQDIVVLLNGQNPHKYDAVSVLTADVCLGSSANKDTAR